MIRIEPEDPVKENYDDENASGVYFLEWCDGDHEHRAAFLTLGLGSFGDGTDASDRNFLQHWITL